MDVGETGNLGRKPTSPVGSSGNDENGPKRTDHTGDPNECAVPGAKDTSLSSSHLTDYENFKSAVNRQCEYFDIEDIENVKENFCDAVQKSFKNFFDSIASFGNDKKSIRSPDVITVVSSALEMLPPTAGISVARMLASSLENMCARLAAIFDSTVDEVARTVFSGFCIASAGIRSALPLLGEMATQAKNLDDIFSVLVAAAVMASVYLVTSTISTLLAAHHAILNSPTTAKMAAKVLDERKGVDSNAPSFSKDAADSLKKISQMLKQWKANVSANFLAFAKEFFFSSGAAVSFVSALGKLTPALAVPFVSIISGSISLVANVLETAQGVVDYLSLKDQLEALRQRRTGGENSPELNREIESLERQLKLSIGRIIKGGLNILLSIGSIVLGILPLLMSFSMPILPAILGTVSLASVLILGIAGLVVRKMNNAGSVPKGGMKEENSDEDGTRETDSDNDSDNVPVYHSTRKNGNSSANQKSSYFQDSPLLDSAKAQFA